MADEDAFKDDWLLRQMEGEERIRRRLAREAWEKEIISRARDELPGKHTHQHDALLYGEWGLPKNRSDYYKPSKPKEGKGMNNTSLYAPIYDQSVMMHEVVYHDTDGTQQGKRYCYKSAIKVEVGDTVLCEARGWYQLCTVVAVDVSIPIETDTKYKWIVANVSLHSHDTLREWEQGLIDEVARKRVDNIRQQLIANLGVNPNDLTMLMSHDDNIDPAVLDTDDDRDGPA